MGEEMNEKTKRTKKILKIAIILTVILFFLVLGIMLYMNYVESKTLKLYVDKTRAQMPSTLFSFDQTSGKLFVSIEDLAKIGGYEYYHGDYNKLTEENTKCYVNNKKEVAGYESGSNLMYKLDPTANTTDYDWYTMSEPARTINGKIYVDSDDAGIGLNLKIKYNQQYNRIEIITLNYLVSQYESIVSSNYGYSGVAPEYKNQKALLYDLIVVRKQEEKDKYKYGVITTDNKDVIGAKYDAIEFIEVSKDFYVTTNKKMGIFSSEGSQKIEPNYDSIKILDNDLRLYYVQNNNMYGVLDKNGKRVVYIEYEKIGVDTTQFKTNDIKNSMLLFDNIIPVMKGKKWGAFDKNGNQVLDTVYDSFGCITSSQKDQVSNNVLVIPDIEGIVVCRDKKYGIINSSGKAVAPCAFNRIYSVTNSGKEVYYLDYNGQQISITDYMKMNGSSTSGQTTDGNTTSAQNTTGDNTGDSATNGNQTADNTAAVQSNDGTAVTQPQPQTQTAPVNITVPQTTQTQQP